MDWSASAIWVALASAIIAGASLWNAILARRIAKGSYQLAVESRNRTTPSLELYIDDGYIRRLQNPARRVFVFRVVVTNRSDAPNSLKLIRLMIEHRRGEGPFSQLEVASDATCAEALGFSGNELLQVPLPIAQRAVVAGTILFPVVQELLAETRIEAYTVSLIDTFQKESAREVLLLTERPGVQKQMA
jgi:hypothetical protein